MPNEIDGQYDTAATAAANDPASDNLSGDTSVTDPVASSQPAVSDTQPTVQTPTPPQFNSQEWALEEKGQKFFPKDRNELLSWARKGRDYSQRAAELKNRAAEVEKLEKQLEQYKKLDSAFRENPELQSKIMSYYQETLNKAQNAQQQNGGVIPPEIQSALGELKTMKQEFDTIKQEREDQALSLEIEALRKKFPNEKWDEASGDEELPLIKKVLKAAYDEGLSSLEKAYKLVTYDNVKVNAEAEAKKAMTEKQVQDAKAGIVSSPASGTPKPKGIDYGKSDYKDLAAAAAQDKDFTLV